MKKSTVSLAILSSIFFLSIGAFHAHAQALPPVACDAYTPCPSGYQCIGNPGSCIADAPTGGAGTGTLGSDLQGLIRFSDNYLVPLIFAVAFIVFLWGVFQYFILGAGNDEKRKEGRTFMIYALIGFVVMLSIWGILNLITNSLGFDSGTRPHLPTFGS